MVWTVASIISRSWGTLTEADSAGARAREARDLDGRLAMGRGTDRRTTGAGPWPLGAGVGLLEALDRFRGGGVDLEELVELGDGEDLVDLGVDVGEAELAALGVDLVADGDEGPECGRGEVVDVGEADEQ